MTAPTHSHIDAFAKTLLRSYVLQISTVSEVTTITPNNVVAAPHIAPPLQLEEDATALKTLTTASEFLVRARSLPGDMNIDPDFAYVYNRMWWEAAGRDAVKKEVCRFGEEYSMVTHMERMQWVQRALVAADDAYSEMWKRFEAAESACADRPTKKTWRKLRDADKALQQARNRVAINAKQTISAINEYTFVLANKVYWGQDEFPSEVGSYVALAVEISRHAEEARWIDFPEGAESGESEIDGDQESGIDGDEDEQSSPGEETSMEPDDEYELEEESDSGEEATKRNRKRQGSDFSEDGSPFANACKATSVPTKEDLLDVREKFRGHSSEGEFNLPEKGKKGKGKAVAEAKGHAKPTKNMKIKEEDLDISNIAVPMRAQEQLNDAFLGYVRIDIVDMDPTVHHVWKPINKRDVTLSHKKTMIDPSCLSPSPYPVKNLKPLMWTCPPSECVAEYLSGNHRHEAVTEYRDGLRDEKEVAETKLTQHMNAQAARGQTEIVQGTDLGARVEERLKVKIALLGEATANAGKWMQKLYDKLKLASNIAGTALLATNEVQPANAADAQEKVQMMAWRIDEETKAWLTRNLNLPAPAPGTTNFCKDILNVAFTSKELKEGTANFLFVEADNFTLIQDLWQLSYFGLTGKVPLEQLETALGKVSKKDLSKKSGSSMLWRWVMHKLMRDLRMIAMTDEFPDMEDENSETAHHMANLVKVLEGSEGPLYITEGLWKDVKHNTKIGCDKPAAQAKMQVFAHQTVLKRYEHDEDVMVGWEKLCERVWDPSILNIADETYITEFCQTGVSTYFRDWKNKRWQKALSKYRTTVTRRFKDAWEVRLEDIGDGEEDKPDAIALHEAEDKLVWLFKLQQLSAHVLDVPFLSDKFLQDFSQIILAAEAGFKLTTRTLDLSAQIGLLRVAVTDSKSTIRQAAKDALCSWLLSNLPLIRKCSNLYQRKYLRLEHAAFYMISPNTLLADAVKIHDHIGDKDFAVSMTFPAILKSTFETVEFTEADHVAVIDIFYILTESASRSLPNPILTPEQTTDMIAAREDVLGRCLTDLSLSDVARFPCLSILYRHGLSWQTPEGAARKGKFNGFLMYAYFLFMSCVFMATRLGACSRPNLDDFLSKHTERPSFTSFVNWDYKVLNHFVDAHGTSIAPKKNADGTPCPVPIKYTSGTVELYDTATMAKHTATVKKVVDSIIKCPLAKYSAHTGMCSPRIARLTEEIATELLRIGLEDNFIVHNPIGKPPYVEVIDEDIEQFCPPLPQLEPTKYLLFCHGLIAEGYEHPDPEDPAEGSSSTASRIYRQSSHRSGEVYLQDVKWIAEWAKVNPDALDATTLPDPVGKAKQQEKQQAKASKHLNATIPPPAKRRRNNQAARGATAGGTETAPQESAPATSAVESEPAPQAETAP
ncbi:hypothetical protein V8D89_006641 [Ganoderma adspersum]